MKTEIKNQQVDISPTKPPFISNYNSLNLSPISFLHHAPRHPYLPPVSTTQLHEAVVSSRNTRGGSPKGLPHLRQASPPLREQKDHYVPHPPHRPNCRAQHTDVNLAEIVLSSGTA